MLFHLSRALTRDVFAAFNFARSAAPSAPPVLIASAEAAFANAAACDPTAEEEKGAVPGGEGFVELEAVGDKMEVVERGTELVAAAPARGKSGLRSPSLKPHKPPAPRPMYVEE